MRKKSSSNNKVTHNKVRNSDTSHNGQDGKNGADGIAKNGAIGINGISGQQILQNMNAFRDIGNVQVIHDDLRLQVILNGVTIVDINKADIMSNNNEKTGEENE